MLPSAEATDPSSSVSEPSSPEGETTNVDDAVKLIAQGKRDLVCSDIPAAVECFQEACRLLAAQYGDFGDEVGEAYLHYGKALLEMARSDNGVIGSVFAGAETRQDDDDDSEHEDNCADEANEAKADSSGEKKGTDGAGGESAAVDSPAEQTTQSSALDSSKTADVVKDDKGCEGLPRGDSITSLGNDASEPSAVSTDKVAGSTWSHDGNTASTTLGSDAVMEKAADDAAAGKAADDAAAGKSTDDAAPGTAADDAAVGKSADVAAAGKAANDAAAGEAADDAATGKAADDAATGKAADDAATGKAADDAATGKAADDAATGKAADDAAAGKAADGAAAGKAADGAEQMCEEAGAAADADDDNEGDKVPPLQLAWEVLEMAKVIFSRHSDKERKLKAADAHQMLGEVSLESEMYDQAIEDFNNCLRIQSEVLGASDRDLAATHYQLGMAYNMVQRHGDAISQFSTAKKILQERASFLEQHLQDNRNGDANGKLSRELEEIVSLLPEIAAKIEDCEEEARVGQKVDVMLRAAVASTMAGYEASSSGFEPCSSSSGSKPALVNNISNLIRKKKADREDNDTDAKKPKIDESGEDAGHVETVNSASASAVGCGDSQKDSALPTTHSPEN